MLGSLIDVTRCFDQLHVRDRQLAIQLVQIGNDANTSEHLADLDAALVAGLKVCRLNRTLAWHLFVLQNMVRVAPFNKLAEEKGSPYKCLLGGLSGNIAWLLDDPATQRQNYSALSRLR